DPYSAQLCHRERLTPGLLLRHAGPHERLGLLGAPASLLQRSEQARNLAEPNLGGGPPGAAHAKHLSYRDGCHAAALLPGSHAYPATPPENGKSHLSRRDGEGPRRAVGALLLCRSPKQEGPPRRGP